jgi:hypothetical protein
LKATYSEAKTAYDQAVSAEKVRLEAKVAKDELLTAAKARVKACTDNPADPEYTCAEGETPAAE